ncbi:acyl-CoA dehydrogenase family protein [Amycolatopsis minnesotensis]|uniref:Flavin-dependent monooxygenase n=1 Tax=Amycolatopsis minnesotensis TaxID=337894 RepID=A0ABP5C107_9PSEU
MDTVTEVLPLVDGFAAEADAKGVLPASLVDALLAAGCFRLAAPARHGGSAVPLPELLGVLEALATADGSTAWVVGQAALSQLIIDCAPEATVAELYAAGPDLLAAGAVAPKGRATAVTGGRRVKGRWPFVTGCERAQWFYVNCVLVRDRSVELGPDGGPLTRIVLLPRHEIEIADTWQVLGLRATGSHDVAVAGAVCQEPRMITMDPTDPATARARTRIAESSLLIAAVVVGIAAAALGYDRELATGGKRPALSRTSLASSTVFHDQLGEAHTELLAARALLYRQAEASAARERAGLPATARDRAELRACATKIIATASGVVGTAHRLAGGSSVYDSSPMQRRVRDAHTATQHFVAARDSYSAFGAALLTADPGA